MMMGTEKFLNDDELDKLLATASPPVIPQGFETRFAARLRQTPGPSNVVAFPVQKAPVDQKSVTRWPLAAALAASLVIGFWLGGDTRVNNLLDDNVDVAMNASSANDFGPAGFDDLTNLESGSQS